MAFDVASVKLNKSGLPGRGGDAFRANVPLDPGPSYFPNGGLYSSANVTLSSYIAFAYDLDAIQLRYAMPGLPAWVNERFDVEARAGSNNPTKDQMRLMMQSLLADRFKLALHAETRQIPFYALVLAVPGKTGPQLQPHVEDPPCADGNAPPSVAVTNANKSPILDGIGRPFTLCGELQVLSVTGHPRAIARGLSLPVLASYVASFAQLDRLAVDRTGLSGTFDVTLDFVLPPEQTRQSSNADPSDPAAPPSIITALKEQLGAQARTPNGPSRRARRRSRGAAFTELTAMLSETVLFARPVHACQFTEYFSSRRPSLVNCRCWPPRFALHF